jgi:hypothetical protein
MANRKQSTSDQLALAFRHRTSISKWQAAALGYDFDGFFELLS